jgi:hypothetical protein
MGDDRTSSQRVTDWARTRRAAIVQEMERLQEEDKRCETILAKFDLPYSRLCSRCRRVIYSSQPMPSGVFFCSSACAD